jgi:hypothetical protein
MSLNDFRPSRVAPIWGFHSQPGASGATIADFPNKQSESTPLLTQVSAVAISDAHNLGARSIVLGLVFENAGVSVDLELYKVVPGTGDVLVKSWSGVTPLNLGTGLWAGNLEKIDLEGKPVKVKITKITGGWASVSAALTS